MNLRSPLLSLCIPTYNRAGLLRQMLQSILNDLAAMPHARGVEIVIANNASSDDTRSVISDFQQRYPEVAWNIHHHAVSVGADNVQIVTDYARGEFVWILSDDDLLLPGAISRLMAELNPETDAVVVTCNHFIDGGAPGGLVQPVLPAAYRNGHTRPSEVIGELGTWITFLSVLCFRHSLTQDIDYRPTFGTNLPQSYMFMDALLHSRRTVYVSEPLLSMRHDNAGGYSYFKVFVNSFNSLLDYGCSRGLDAATAARIRTKHLRGFLISTVIAHRINRNGRFNIDWAGTRRLFYQAYSTNATYWLGAVPVLYLPTGLLRLLFNAKQIARRAAASLRR
ncbi:glycosyltransferase family 2 protein [Deinococcus aquaedulcis]|uniref:glycosyltransferase family 2 protein n=1 Tax=Deinococcus aquaedulcis TaxID=2840455 RepID=UPI001C83C73D|nr:glycosyltransferase family 2 protein [Deinococcus aquaedulcis]